MLSLGCSHDVGLTFVNQLQWQAQVCTGKPPIIYGHRERSPAAGKNCNSRLRVSFFVTKSPSGTLS